MTAPRTWRIWQLLVGVGVCVATAARLAANPTVSNNGGSAPLAGRASQGGSASTAGSPPSVDSAVHPVTTAVTQGQYWRLIGDGGPIHVWTPPGYHADDASVVVYVHGYYTDVDTAWREHQLPEQFAMAGINAVFIACEAPNGLKQNVHYPDLGALIRFVLASTQVARPTGPWVALGHSGAFRTLKLWRTEPTLETMILLDAVYAENDAFHQWLQAAPNHRLLTIGDDTLRWTEELARDAADTLTIDWVPYAYAQWPAAAYTARHVYVRSQYGHMPIVTNGWVIPQFLRLVGAPTLPDTAWQTSPGDLPAKSALPLAPGATPGGAPTATSPARHTMEGPPSSNGIVAPGADVPANDRAVGAP